VVLPDKKVLLADSPSEELVGVASPTTMGGLPVACADGHVVEVRTEFVRQAGLPRLAGIDSPIPCFSEITIPDVEHRPFLFTFNGIRGQDLK
jgi:hypothetical protein